MRVRATELCYYGDRRQRPDQVFTLKDPKHFNPKCMEKVGGDRRSGGAKAAKMLNEAPLEDADDFGDEDSQMSTGDQEVI